MMPGIFISYRTIDEPWVANWLCSELAARLGPDEVFLDSRSIPPGEAYEPVLLSRISSSAVVIVVIGSRWLASGRRGRLVDDRTDWVRREIAAAFAAGVRVLPVLVGDVPDLSQDDLPDDIRRLACLQWLRIRSREAHQHIPRAVDGIIASARLSGHPT